MEKKIIFTGGGSGGHVVPAITLIRELQKNNSEIEIFYIGSKNGIERELISGIEISYKPITTGKLRRYISFENLKDMFRVLLGVVEAFIYLLKFNRSTLVFSTGGFVSVPVVIAAFMTGKKVFVHEQTSRIGLANKIASKFATKFFISFKETEKFIPKNICEFSGYPVRDECLSEDIGRVEIKGVHVNSLEKPVLFFTGGGNGSVLINDFVKRNLQVLTEKFYVIHQVGKLNYHEFEGLKSGSYLPVMFVGSEMIDLFKLSKCVVSRAGAGTVSELIALGKMSIYIPLKIAQKNEQFHNAMEASRLLGSLILEEDAFSDESLLKLIDDFKNEDKKRAQQKWTLRRLSSIRFLKYNL